MPSPFPGMNPYLEAPGLWSEVHSWLIVELARMLNQRIIPKYRAAVEKRVYEESLTATLSQPILLALPEAETTIERYLEVREVATGEVVTVVEILSPKNKRFSMGEAAPTGEGRDQYLNKRQKVLGSQSHLVEIDLLRGGEALPMQDAGRSDYRVLVSRVEQRPIAELYPFNLRDRLPCFGLPLKAGDESVPIDLNVLMQMVYESAALDLAIDYGQQPTPGLSQDDFDWVQKMVGG
jgi:Protein of unknown function (DUF4058)